MPKVRVEKKCREHTQRAKGGINFNTAVGQHILKNPGVITRMIEKSKLRATDKVLEVGPGTGNLTVKILENCNHLTACELDPRMGADVQKRIDDLGMKNKFRLMQGDVMDLDKLPYFDVCISNLPYQISSPFVFKLLLHRPHFRCATLMFQKEFAERLVARPGSKLYSRLSVNTQLLAKVEMIIVVKKTSFTPPPKVDSAVVKIEPIIPAPAINFTEWDGLTRIAFGRKNKTLGASFGCKSVVSMIEKNYRIHCSRNNKTIPEDFCMRTKILGLLQDNEHDEKRARTMDMDDFLSVLSLLNSNDIHLA